MTTLTPTEAAILEQLRDKPTPQKKKRSSEYLRGYSAGVNAERARLKPLILHYLNKSAK